MIRLADDQRALRLDVIDDGSSRADLAERQEVKFAFPRADLAGIRRLLTTNCRRLVYNNSVSTVRSIYFDDYALGACHANLDGVADRNKLRIRWYDRPTPGSSFFVEVKWRRNRVTGKHRLQVASSGCPSDHGFDALRDAMQRDLPPSFLPFTMRYHEPTMFVEYRREHFASHDGVVRLTLDHRLGFAVQLGARRPSTRFVERVPDLVVLEGKVPVGREALLSPLLAPLRVRATRSSKYVLGCLRLGLAADIG